MKSYDFLHVNVAKRYINLGSITENSARELVTALTEMSGRKPINLVINSGGGSVADAFGMFDAIRIHPAKINGIVFGDALSAALLVLQACDKRVISVNSRIMLHEGSSSVSKSVPRETVADAKEIARLGERFEFLLAQCSGNTVQQIQRMCFACTFYTAQQAVEKGFADMIVGDRHRTPNKGMRRRRSRKK